MPRIEPNSNRGLVSDVCLKRKIRNYIELFKPTRKDDENNGFNILIQQGNVIETEQKKAEDIAKGKLPKGAKDDVIAEKAANWLCQEFFDVRTFGSVVSTGRGPLRGSAFGQIRGPVQLTFAQSLHPINPLEVTITRCVVTKESDKDKKDQEDQKAQERTMGHKYIVPYGLYMAKGYVSPPFAEKTGFDKRDLCLVFKALLDLFEHDHSAARGEMQMRGLYVFEHVGTQHENNAKQNSKEARLGCTHAHKLFDGIRCQLTEEAQQKGYPENFSDYQIICDWDQKDLPKGVKLHKYHERPDLLICD